MSSDSPTSPPPIDSGSDGTHAILLRSGAVARLLRMPVATLRVWERRYGLTHTRHSGSGQRLYSEGDVRRLALIKQLTDLGHAIGSLAMLDLAQLQQVAANHHAAAQPPSTPQRHQSLHEAAPWRLAVVGNGWAQRISRPDLLQRLGRPVQLLGPFDNPAALAHLRQGEVDALVVQEPQLHAGWLAALEAAAPNLAGVPKAVFYGFAADAVCESLAAVGVSLLRAPQPDAVLVQWLRPLAQGDRPTQPEASSPAAASAAAPAASGAVPPQRWDDAALAEFASRSNKVGCGCPRHVAELLMQLAQFERYSADCEDINTADAALHADLHRVAALARSQFEVALARVAAHEGLALPLAVST